MTGNPSVSRYPIAPPDTPPLCVNSNFKRLHHRAAVGQVLSPRCRHFHPAFNYQLLMMMRNMMMRNMIMRNMTMGNMTMRNMMMRNMRTKNYFYAATNMQNALITDVRNQNKCFIINKRYELILKILSFPPKFS